MSLKKIINHRIKIMIIKIIVMIKHKIILNRIKMKKSMIILNKVIFKPLIIY